MFKEIIIPIAIFAGLGLVFGIILAVASKIFSVKRDEKAEKIDDVLPHANCGACGYSGCAAYAEAIAKGEAKELNLCTVGGEPVAKHIGEIMGVDVVAKKRYVARVMCSGSNQYSKKKYAYHGTADCLSAARLSGGDKMCPNACIGLGSCVSVCKYHALSVIDGVAVVNPENCVACRACVDICPKNIIQMVPYDSNFWVCCVSAENGPMTREHCDTGCISCRLCVKACEYDAISINDFHATIDYNKCVSCGKCMAVCPRHIIHTKKS